MSIALFSFFFLILTSLCTHTFMRIRKIFLFKCLWLLVIVLCDRCVSIGCLMAERCMHCKWIAALPFFQTKRWWSLVHDGHVQAYHEITFPTPLSVSSSCTDALTPLFPLLFLFSATLTGSFDGIIYAWDLLNGGALLCTFVVSNFLSFPVVLFCLFKCFNTRSTYSCTCFL